MDLRARKEYAAVVKERYWKARSKKEKSLILNEYCANTGQARKYAIRKLRCREKPDFGPRRRRTAFYDGQVTAALVKIWEIFDYPCGQRLKPLIGSQTDRLRQFGELAISDEVADKLKTMSAATIDRKLKHQKEVLHLQWSRRDHKAGPALKHQIAIRLTSWDIAHLGCVPTGEPYGNLAFQRRPRLMVLGGP